MQSILELCKLLKDNDEDSFVYIVIVLKCGYKLMVLVIWYSEEEGEEIMLFLFFFILEVVFVIDFFFYSFNI